MDIAWFAGLFEGEGTCGIGKDFALLQVAMTDYDIMERINQMYPTVRGLRPIRKTQEHHRPAWIWGRYSREGIREVLNEILPYLGKRRTARAHEVLAWLDLRPGTNHKSRANGNR